MLKTNSLSDLSTSATQIVVEYNGVNDNSGQSGNFDKKFHSRLQYNSRITHLDTQDECINGPIN